MTAELKLGINVGYWQRDPEDQTETVLAAERCGYDSVFTAEAYGSDAFTPLAWYAARTSRIKLGTAVVQMSARTPAATSKIAQRLMDWTGMAPERVAKTTLDALDRRQLYVLPQFDARLVWRLKRFTPVSYGRVAGLIGRIVARPAAS